MAVRCEEMQEVTVEAAPGRVVRFPSERVRARARSQRRAEIRRRRLTLALFPVLVFGFILASGPGGTSVASRSGAPESVVLEAGDTVWDLASRYAPESVDPRAYVDTVLELNDVSGAPAAGARLRLP
jgi:hypothetical protein